MDTNTRLKFNDPAPDLELQTATGQTVRLASLWEGKTLVLAFTRHFGCPQCKELLSELTEALPALQKAGLSLAAVTQGTPAETGQFCQQYAPKLLCLADPQHKAYQAYGLGRGSLGQTVLSGKVWRSNAALRKAKGWKPEMPPTGQDAMQMAGVFIIGSDGKVRLPYYYDNIADHPAVELLLGGILGSDWRTPLDAPIGPENQGRQSV